MKHSTLVLSLFAFTVWTADQARGQAIIEYGISVGRAGAAGTAAGATGAGIAGIFSNLNGRLSEQPKTQSGARTAQPEFDSESLERRPPSFSTSGTTLETSSGVRISGHPSTPAPVMPARYQARSLDYEPAASAASPASSAGDSTAAQPEPSAAAAEGEAEPAEAAAPASTPELQETPQPAAGQPVAVTGARTAAAGNTAPAEKTAIETDPALRRLLEIDSEIADIPEGTSIEDVIARFGKPIFKMAGLPGQNYSEKYIFRTADGRRFTVFTRDGLVAHTLVEPLVLGNRAAL